MNIWGLRCRVSQI